MDCGEHIAFCRLELAWLCCCLVMWCGMWKGTTRDCNDHIRRMHQVTLSVRPANLAKFFPAWTITREQWADLLLPSISGVAVDTLFFSHMASPLGHRYWLFSQTGSQYDAVFSVEAFPVVCGARDIRQFVRRCASPPGGQTRGAARVDRQHETPALVVDLKTGKCRPGKVSRTVSASPLMLDLTVMYTSGVMVPPPGVSTQVVLPPVTVAITVTAVGTSTPFVATPAPVVEQPGTQAKEFPTLRLSESPELLLSFGLSSSSPSPTLPWGAADDSSPPFSLSRVQVGHSQDVLDEDSSFSAFTGTRLSASTREYLVSGWITTKRQYSEYRYSDFFQKLSGISPWMDQIARRLVVTFRRATMIGLRRKNILVYLHSDDQMLDVWQKDYVLQLDNWRKQWSGCSRT